MRAAEQRPTHMTRPEGPDERRNDDIHLDYVGSNGPGKRDPGLGVEQSVPECFVRVFFRIREEGFRPWPEGKGIHFSDRDWKSGRFSFIGAIQNRAEPGKQGIIGFVIGSDPAEDMTESMVLPQAFDNRMGLVGQVFIQFFKKTGSRAGIQQSNMAWNFALRALVDLESKPGGVADDAPYPNGVFPESLRRVADDSDRPRPEIFDPADVIDHSVYDRVVEKAVDGDVSPERIFERRAVKTHPMAVRLRDLFLVPVQRPAKRRDLDDPSAADVDMNQPKTAPDHISIRKPFFNLSGPRISDNIEVFRPLSEHEIADASSRQIGNEALAVKTGDDLESVGIDHLARNRVIRMA